MGRIQIKAAVVLELFDQYTGKPIIEGQAWLETDGEQKMIQKGNGCYVFLYPYKQDQKIIIHSKIFREMEITFPQPVEDEFQHQILWLEPQETYPSHANATYLSGSVTKSKYLDPIKLYLKKSGRTIRLAKDYEPGQTQIMLYGVTGEVANTEYVLCKGKDHIFFSIQGVGSMEDSYLLTKPLTEAFKKEDTAVYIIYKAAVREDHSFFIMLPEVTEDTAAYIVINQKQKTIQIEKNKWNRFI